MKLRDPLAPYEIRATNKVRIEPGELPGCSDGPGPAGEAGLASDFRPTVPLGEDECVKPDPAGLLLAREVARPTRESQGEDKDPPPPRPHDEG